MSSRKTVQRILQYTFRDPAVLDEALGVGSSNAPKHARKRGKKALALIGDAVLRLVIVDDGIFDGSSTCICQGICEAEISNAALHGILKQWDLTQCIKSPHYESDVSQRAGASTVEALVGAVWIDSRRDFVKVHHVVHNLNVGVGLLHSRSHKFGEAILAK